MNKLDALKIFCTVSETLNFRDAAQRLAVSPQVVTRTINKLEQELGEILFQRNTRQVKLTDFAQQFLPQAKQILTDTDSLFSQSKKKYTEKHIAGLVRIAVPEMALMREILSELYEKLADYPDLIIDWRSDLGLANVVNEQIDVGIRFGTPEDNRLIIRQVGTAEDCIVASPTLIQKIGKPQDWKSLQRNYPLSTLINPNTGRIWNWYLSNQYQFQPNRPKFITNCLENELISVLQGNTFACLPRLMCLPYLQAGKLVEIFPELERKQWAAYVYRPQQTITHPRVKLVFNLLAEILQVKLKNNITLK